MCEIIRKLLRPEIFLEIDSNDCLCFSDVGVHKGGLKRIKIEGIPPGSVAFSLDQSATTELKKKFGILGYKKLSWLIHDNHEQANKKCDFVLISPYQKSYKILICELKSSRPKPKSYFYQLLNSRLYVNYILSLVNEYHSNEIQVTNPIYRLILFTNTTKYRKMPTIAAVNQKPDFGLNQGPFIYKMSGDEEVVNYEDIEKHMMAIDTIR